MTFGGCLTGQAKGFIEGFIARAMVRNGRGGDFRDPERIVQWSKRIAAALAAHAPHRAAPAGP